MDGGWGQVRRSTSGAHPTGQRLYLLSLAGVKNERAEARRGVACLVADQKEEGSWPMTARAHEGAKPSANLAPIIHLGSAWATLGLMRAVDTKAADPGGDAK